MMHDTTTGASPGVTIAPASAPLANASPHATHVQEPAPAASAGARPGRAQPAHQRQRLGPLLCWAVVFADIGTSVYYTPGILYGTAGIGTHAALFVTMTMVVFILLALKYAEVTIRYPEGGGVVTVGTRAIHPFVGLIGGMFILVDYFLTAAISADSGIGYFAFVMPSINSNLLIGGLAILALIVLGVLNWVGISESAKVSATFATIAFASQVVVVLAVVIYIGPGNVLALIPRALTGSRLAPLTVLTGYAGAFLAFSGLESISQLSPVMAEPRRRVARLAMGAVVATIALTSPLLTLLSTTLINSRTIISNQSTNALLSILADHHAGHLLGQALGVEVALSGSVLLLFACNTAIIGSYHVFLALSRMRFFPEFIERRNQLRGTPHFAILLAVIIPVLILIPASASPNTQLFLGDLYAFGLLGAFSVTCLSLDVVRWRERRAAPHLLAERAKGRPDHGKEVAVPIVGRAMFAIGILTTFLVMLAWSTNLVNKLSATEFGSSVAAVGVLVALVNYARLNRRGLSVAFPSKVRTSLQDAVMVLLPPTTEQYDELIQTARAEAAGRPVVFVYRGTTDPSQRRPGIFEVVDPYLDDRAAKDALGRAERISRRLGLDRRYVYLPGGSDKDAMARVWQTIRPRDTLAAAGDEETLREIAADRVRRPTGKALPVVHYLKHW